MSIRQRIIKATEASLAYLPLSARVQLFKRLRNTLPGSTLFEFGWLSMEGALDNLRRRSYSPTGVVDVGAHKGDWARIARKVLGVSPIVMIEADPDNEKILERVCSELGDNASHCIALLGRETRTAVPFFAMGTGSSVLEELTQAPRSTIQLPMRRLDDVLKGSVLPQSGLLLKLDVQGYELEVLSGAPQTLARSDVVILEVAVREYNRGAPLLHDVVNAMHGYGFVSDDVCGLSRRRLDAALLQMDILFVRQGHALRAAHANDNTPV